MLYSSHNERDVEAVLARRRIAELKTGVGIYCRISDDVAGNALGVQRQEEDCRVLANLRKWPVEEVFVDNDFSAFKKNVVRPAFERMLLALKKGDISGIMVYDLDRLARQPVDLERIISIYDDHPLVFASVQGDIDLSTPDGRTMARVMVAFANKASMDTSRRVKRKHLELARNGVPVGGNRPFGYRRDKKTLEKQEASLIVEAANQVLNGVGLHTIARQWNDRGIKTTCGNVWRTSVLRNLLRSPRLAGFRVYQGGIARNEDGSPVIGQHPPILDVETWEAVVALLTARKRKDERPGRRKYLLTGIVRCGACNVALLHGNADKKNNTFNYHCEPSTSGGCGKVSISGPKLDAMITELVLRYLAERDVEQEAAPFPGEDELQEVTARLYELMNRFAEGEVSGEVVFPTVTKLEDRIAALRADRTAWLSEHLVTRTDAAESWDKLDTDQRRSVIQSVLHAVIVKRAPRRGGRFDPERVEAVWR